MDLFCVLWVNEETIVFSDEAGAARSLRNADQTACDQGFIDNRTKWLSETGENEHVSKMIPS